MGFPPSKRGGEDWAALGRGAVMVEVPLAQSYLPQGIFYPRTPEEPPLAVDKGRVSRLPRSVRLRAWQDVG